MIIIMINLPEFIIINISKPRQRVNESTEEHAGADQP